MTEIKPEGSERIAKFMAQAGIASRRDAERLIESGKVKVNGKVIDSPVIFVTADDVVEVDGELAEAATTSRVWMFHKPAGCLTTHRDPEGRATIFDHLPPHLPRVITVGRLDYNSEGLLLLTNDGALSRYLTLPETGWARHYRVRVFGKPGEQELEKLRSGLTVEGVEYRPAQVEIESTTASHTWLSFTLREGKNREIRKLCEAVGIVVTRLIRTSFGPFQLGSLEVSEVKEISARILKEQLADFYAGQDAGAPKPSSHEPYRRSAPPREQKLKTKGRIVIRKERTTSREEKEEKRQLERAAKSGKRGKPPFKKRDSESGEKREFRPRTDRAGKPPFKRREEGEGAKKGFRARPNREGFSSTRSGKPPFKRRDEEGGEKREFRPRPPRDGKRFDSPRGERGAAGSKPFRRREEGDGEKREFRPRTDRSGKPPFKRRDEASSGDRESRPRREGFSPRGDKPTFRRREEGDAEKREFRPRTDRSGKPPFKRRDEEGGEKREFRSRPDRGGKPPFKRRDEGGGGKKEFRRGERPERAGPGEERAAAMRGGRPPFKKRDAESGEKEFRPRQRPHKERPAGDEEDGRMTGRARPSRPRSWETGNDSPKRSGPRKPKGPRGAKDYRR